jgi:hypothetical protein
MYDLWIDRVVWIVLCALALEVCNAGETGQFSRTPVVESQPVPGSIDMSGDTISVEELGGLTKTLANVVAGVKSMEELEVWLRSRPYIESVNKADYLIKTEPPQKELQVRFKMDDGSTVVKVLDILLYPDQTFGLSGLHNP